MYTIHETALFHRTPRTYPVKFGEGLHEMMSEWRPQPRLRQKKPVDLTQSDKELFCGLPLGDKWADANLVDAYMYLRSSERCHIPDTWKHVFEELDLELASPN